MRAIATVICIISGVGALAANAELKPQKGPVIHIQEEGGFAIGPENDAPGRRFSPYDEKRLAQDGQMRKECITGLIGALRSSPNFSRIAPYIKNVFLVTNSYRGKQGLLKSSLVADRGATYDVRNKSLTLTAGNCSEVGRAAISAKDIDRSISEAWERASANMAGVAAGAIQDLTASPNNDFQAKTSGQVFPVTPGKSHEATAQNPEAITFRVNSAQ